MLIMRTGSLCSRVMNVLRLSTNVHTALPVLILLLLLLGACSTIPRDYPRQATSALTTYEDTRLGRKFSRLEAAHPDKSGFYLLSDGVDAFIARLMLMEAAQRTLDIQYYIYRFDVAGQIFSQKLLDAADRGVRVRLLLDDLEIEENAFNFAVLASHPNIQVRFFNPLVGRSVFGLLWSMLIDFERVNQRMHNKIFAVDNQLAIVGGRNIADDYFSVEPNQYFADLDLLAVGPIVREASVSFDEFWNSELSIPAQVMVRQEVTSKDLEDLTNQLEDHWTMHEAHAYRKRLRQAGFNQGGSINHLEFVWAPARIFYDTPDKISRDGHEKDQVTLMQSQIEPHFDKAETEIRLISPYLIPGEEGMSLFRRVRQRGVNFSILTNSLAATDISAVYGAYADYRKPVLNLGIDLFELKPDTDRKAAEKDRISSVGATLHAKTIMFDHAEVFIGSMNLDPRSVYFNTELGLIITSPELTAQVRDLFDRLTRLESSLRLTLDEDGKLIWTTLEEGRKVTYDRSPYVSWWRIIWSDIFALLVPNSLL